MSFKNRIPALAEILPVYGAISAVTFVWSMIQFTWNLNSWLYFSTPGEILTIFAYTMTAHLAESLLILFALTAFFFILPSAWTFRQFTAKATLTALLLFSVLIYRNSYFPTKALSELPQRQWLLIFGALALIAVFPFGKAEAARAFIENLADRAVVFLYITVPLGVLSLIAVLARNLF